MPDKSHYWLHSVSVVVTAEFHNPSILSPDFLKANRIVPENWEPGDVITTPQFSNLQFQNGIAWTVDQSKLTVVDTCESVFRTDYRARAYDLVASYLRVLPHVPYRSLGLNFVVTIRRDDPLNWLTERYLRDDFRLLRLPNRLTMVPRFTIPVDDGILCSLSLEAGTSQLDGSHSQPAVIANCNVHHEGIRDTDLICQAINQWPKRQEFVTVILNQLLGDSES